MELYDNLSDKLFLYTRGILQNYSSLFEKCGQVAVYCEIYFQDCNFVQLPVGGGKSVASGPVLSESLCACPDKKSYEISLT